MNLKSILFIFSIFISSSIAAQCEIKIQIPSTDVCLGDTIPIKAIGGCGIIFQEDFNDSNLYNSGLNLNTFSTYGTPCLPSLDLSPYLWVGMNANGPHELTTPSLNLTPTGVKINFDIVYGVNGDPSPCDGPANLSEAVHLQYSTNGGTTWTDIVVFDPLGGNDSIRTAWQHQSISLPLAAQTTNTRLRWSQSSISAINTICWGIDNIYINKLTNYNVLWSDGVSTLNHPPISPSNSGLYWVTINDLNSTYKDSAAVYINVHPRPIASFVASQPICKNKDVTFTYTGPSGPSAIYNWTFPGGVISSGFGQGPINVKWDKTGNYDIVLTVSDGICPSYPFEEEILVTPLVSFYATGGKGCQPFTIDLKDNSIPKLSTIKWEFGNGDFSNDSVVSYTYQTHGSYDISLIIKTQGGCSDTFTLQNYIEVYPKPVIAFETNPSIIPLTNPVMDITNLTQYGKNWTWTFGDGGGSTSMSPSYTYSDKGEYIVTLVATSDKNCIDTLSKKVIVIDDDYKTYNVITPNGDGKNDKFIIRNAEDLLSCQLLIYNRWGRLVYQNSKYDNSWDGDNLSDGVYFFQVTYESYFEKKSFGGTFHIIRGN